MYTQESKRKSSRGFLSGAEETLTLHFFHKAATTTPSNNLDMPTTTQPHQLQAIAATAKDAQDLLSSYMQLKQTVKQSRFLMQQDGSVVVTNTYTIYRESPYLTTAKSSWIRWIRCMIYIHPCMRLHEIANKKQPTQNRLWMKSISACRTSCTKSAIF